MKNSKFKVSAIATIALVSLIAVIGGILFAVQVNSRNVNPSASVGAAAGKLTTIRADTRILDTAQDGQVTLVEFLDFECEACKAAFPVMEKIRADYAGRVTFAVRYFPLPSHNNSKNAAIAVEAAALLGSFEPMYQKMFQTQTTWGEKKESQAPYFRSLAQELGLDMSKYDAYVANPDTLKRVTSDVADGVSLGVKSTPSFFINDKAVQLAASFEEIRTALDSALAKTK